MRSNAAKIGGTAAVDDDAVLQINRAGSGNSSEETREQLRDLAQEVMSEISKLDPAHSKELLGAFVSELFLSVAEQERREQRRQKQIEVIAAAKERGVRFGRERLALPEQFGDMAQMWDEGCISASEAARSLGMSTRTFVRRAKEYCAV